MLERRQFRTPPCDPLELTGAAGGGKAPAHPQLDLATAGVVERLSVA
jgi:hypothetical protein